MSEQENPLDELSSVETGIEPGEVEDVAKASGQAIEKAADELQGEATGAQPGEDGPDLGGESAALIDRLAEDTEYDASATDDDRLMAALSYGTQLILPVIVPLIVLLSETSKKRPFQRYHAVQALALSIVVWGLETVLGLLAGIAGATFIGLLCLCVLIPAMILLWLLPLYYAILAYGGKRFTIPGLTQFLKDQSWL